MCTVIVRQNKKFKWEIYVTQNAIRSNKVRELAIHEYRIQSIAPFICIRKSR